MRPDNQFPDLRGIRVARIKAPEAKTGAVIYCRVSTKEQEENYSISTQKAHCTAYCQKHGYEIREVFIETASAKTNNGRPVFEDMLKYCAKNHRSIGAVVVYAVNRFARSVKDHQIVRSQLREKEIRLSSCTQELDDTTAMGRVCENWLSMQAQYDNDQRSERAIDGMKAAIGDGKWCHKAPLGYLNSQSPGGLSLDPKFAGLIQKAFELYGTGQHSKKEALDVLTDLGLKTPKSGKPLSAQTFDKILRNPIYAGVIVSSWGISQRGRFEPIISTAYMYC